MLNKLIKKTIYFLALIAILIITIFNIIYINQTSNNEVSNVEYYGIMKLIISLIIAIGIILISYGLSKIKLKRKIKIVIITLILIIYAIIQIVWINVAVATPYADSEQLLVIAKEMLGDEGLSTYCANYIQ